MVSVTAVAALIVLLPRLWPNASALLVETATRPLDTRLVGFLASYQTNEVNRIASLVAFLLTQIVIFSMGVSRVLKLSGSLLVCALSIVFLLKSVPLLLLWLCAVLAKLLWLRCWSLFFLALTAALLPFGGGIGSPSHALFAIVIATYVTPLGWSQAEKSLSFVTTRYVIGTAIAAAIVLLLIRAGIEVPVVTRVATPLLTERERTYQLENILAWLHKSEYCDYRIDFVERADNPIDSVESAITRRNRPPASLEDVALFWNTVLRCDKLVRPDSKTGIAVVTFGGPGLADSKPVFEAKGRYADEATVWVRASRELESLPCRAPFALRGDPLCPSSNELERSTGLFTRNAFRCRSFNSPRRANAQDQRVSSRTKKLTIRAPCGSRWRGQCLPTSNRFAGSSTPALVANARHVSVSPKDTGTCRDDEAPTTRLRIKAQIAHADT